MVMMVHAWNYTLGTLGVVPSNASQLILVNGTSSQNVLLHVVVVLVVAESNVNGGGGGVGSGSASLQQTNVSYTMMNTQQQQQLVESASPLQPLLLSVVISENPVVPTPSVPKPFPSIGPSPSIIVNVTTSPKPPVTPSLRHVIHSTVITSPLKSIAITTIQEEEEHARSRFDVYRSLIDQVKEWKKNHKDRNSMKRSPSYTSIMMDYSPIFGAWGGPQSTTDQIMYFISNNSGIYSLDNVTIASSSGGRNLLSNGTVKFTELVYGMKAKQGNDPHDIYVMTSGKLWLIKNGVASLLISGLSLTENSIDGSNGTATIYSVNGNIQDIEITENGDVYFLEKRKLRRFRNGSVRTMVNNSGMMLNQPSFMTSAFGMLYISDTGNNRILAFDLTSEVFTTIAGSNSGIPTTGRTDAKLGDALSYSLSQPKGIAVNKNNGIIYFIEGSNIRTLTPTCDSEKEEPIMEFPFCKCKNGLY
nr:unnamed protein product [Naegleria fowleri]